MNGKINSLRDQPSKAGICLKTKYKKPIPTICVKKNPISPIKKSNLDCIIVLKNCLINTLYKLA